MRKQCVFRLERIVPNKLREGPRVNVGQGAQSGWLPGARIAKYSKSGSIDRSGRPWRVLRHREDRQHHLLRHTGCVPANLHGRHRLRGICRQGRFHNPGGTRADPACQAAPSSHSTAQLRRARSSRWREPALQRPQPYKSTVMPRRSCLPTRRRSKPSFPSK